MMRMRPVEASFENGDRATGEYYVEDGRTWFRAIDKDGNEYETEEQPYERIDLTSAEVIIGSPEEVLIKFQ